MDRTATTSKIKELELNLHRAQIRASREQLDQLLTDDFVEFGRSGRSYDKEVLIATLAREGGAADGGLEVHDFAVRFQSETVALVTYRSIRRGAPSVTTNRSSLWRLEGDRWRMAFHQGTPAL